MTARTAAIPASLTEQDIIAVHHRTDELFSIRRATAS